MVKKVWAFIKLGRFIFLAGGFLLYALGATVAYQLDYPTDWTLYVLGQMVVTCTQLMVHYANDYFDYEADLLNTTYTPWSGGSRVLPDGQLPRHVALYAAYVLLGVACLLTLILSIMVPLILPVLVLAIAFSWAYSAPPFSLHARGLGEISATLVVAGLVPMVGFLLQTERFHPEIFWTIAPLLCFQFNMLLSVHFADVESDQAAGKYTLVARLGRQRTIYLYWAMLILAYGLAWLPRKWTYAILFSLPLALIIAVCLPYWTKRAHYSYIAFFSIALLMLNVIFQILAMGIRIRNA